MKDDVVTFCKNHSGFILERWRRGFDEVEEPRLVRARCERYAECTGETRNAPRQRSLAC